MSFYAKTPEPATRTLPRSREHRRSILALVLGVGVSVIGLEILAAHLPVDSAPREVKAMFRGDVPRNSLRFRDFEYPAAKAASHFRILVIGDSFTKGGAVDFDDAYPKRLERYLNTFGDPAGRVFEVLNMGIAGTSTPEQADLLRRRAPELHPDLVIVGYCLNDAEDWSRREELLRIRREDSVGFFHKPEGSRGFLYRHSALARLIAHRIFNYRTYHGQVRYYRALYRDDYSGWQRTREALADIGRYSRETQVPVVVMIFPLFSWGLGDDYPFLEVHAKLHQALDGAGLRTLDLLDRYRHMDRTRLEALPFHDPHPSEIAHRIAAETMWRYLHAQELVPGKGDPGHPWRHGPLVSPFATQALDQPPD